MNKKKIDKKSVMSEVLIAAGVVGVTALSLYFDSVTREARLQKAIDDSFQDLIDYCKANDIDIEVQEFNHAT